MRQTLIKLVELDQGFDFTFEHDLFGKLVVTFPDHALGVRPQPDMPAAHPAATATGVHV
jgi:hypothetical protein